MGIWFLRRKKVLETIDKGADRIKDDAVVVAGRSVEAGLAVLDRWLEGRRLQLVLFEHWVILEIVLVDED